MSVRTEKNHTGKYSIEYTALIGYFASYGGRYFDGGYGRDAKGVRDIYAERLKYAKEQAPLLSGIEFACSDYRELNSRKISNKVVMYLDPPYKDTKTYNGRKFNNEEFYNFVRSISSECYVFISEFDMPPDFKCIWSKERKISQKSDREKSDVKIERLYTIGLSAE